MDVQATVQMVANDVAKILKMDSLPTGAFISWLPSSNPGEYPKVRTFVIYYPSGFKREWRFSSETHSYIRTRLDELGPYIEVMDMYYDFRKRQ